MKGLKKANQEILLTQIVPTLLQMLDLEALGAEEKEWKFQDNINCTQLRLRQEINCVAWNWKT